MSKEIESKVVEMRFDNKQFEAGVAQSMSTLEKLKQKLNFNGRNTGLENIGNAAKKVDMTTLCNSVDVVRTKFSALDVVGVTALANITNSALAAAKRISASFTIEPIRTGFNEYELKMGSVQTIMASTGESLEKVNGYLDELNAYSDRTIYSFSDMTTNIGKFTNAGVKLDDAVLAMKGISNEAAVSGANANEASRAMYNLAQSISMGYVQLIDWKSIENANMATVEFKQQLLDTALSLGVVTKSTNGYTTAAGHSFNMQQMFKDGLKDQWLTTDVLIGTLRNYADETTDIGKKAYAAAQDVKTFSMMMDTLKEAAQSGWAQTWEILVGDFEEAKSLWTELSGIFGKMIDDSAKTRNDLLKGALDSKWDQLVSKINDAGVSTETFQEKLKETAREHGIAIDEMIEKEGSLAKVVSKGKISKDVIIDTLKKFIGVTNETSDATAKVTGNLEDFQKIVNQVIRGDFGNGADRIKALTEANYEYATVQKLVNKIWERNGHTWKDCTITSEDLAQAIGNLSSEELKSIGYTDEQAAKLKELAEQAEKTGTPINELIESLNKPSGRELIIDTVRNALIGLTGVMKSVKTAWSEIFTTDSTSSALYGMIEGIHTLSKHLAASEETVDKLKRTFKGLFAIIDIINTIVGGTFKIAFQVLEKVLSSFDLHILDITASIGDAIVVFHDWLTNSSLLAKATTAISNAIVFVINKIREFCSVFMALPQVQSAIEAFKNKLSELKDVGRSVIDGLQNGLQEGFNRIPKILMEIGVAILNAIKGVLGIHSPSTEMHAVGVNAIAGLVNGLKEGASKVYEVIRNIGTKIIDLFRKIDWNKLFAGGVSVSLLMLVKKLIDVSETLTAPLAGIGAIFSSVAGVIGEATKKVKKVVNNFAKVIKSFSKVLNAKAFSMKADGIKDIAIGIGILAGSVYLLSKIDTAKLWSSVGALTALAGVITLLSVAASKIKATGGTNFAKVSVMMISMSAAVLMLSNAVKKMGSLNPEQMTQGFIGLTGTVVAMGALFAAFGIFTKGHTGQSIDAAGKMMTKMATAMLLMVGVVKLISGMSAGELAKGGIVITAFVGIVGLLSLVTKTAGPNVDKLGKLLMKMSTSMLLMVGVIKLISGLSTGELVKGGAAILAFVGIIELLSLIAKTSGGSMNKLGSTLLAMSTSMLLMVGVIKLVSGLSPEEMVKGSAAILAFVGIIGLMTGIIKKLGSDAPKMAATLLAMSLSIGVLGGIAVLLSMIDTAGLAKGIIAVGMLSALMALMIKSTKGASDCKGNLIVMTVAIATMATAVAALSFIDTGKLAGATLALSALMGMFALVSKAAGTMGKVMAPLIVMTAAIAVLGGIIYLLSGLPIESALGASASLSLLLLSMSAALAIMGTVGSVATDGLVALAGVTLVVTALARILYLMAGLPIESSLGIAASLSILLLSMSASLLILAAVGATGPAAFIGVGALLTLIASLGALMAGIGALVTYIPDMQTWLNTGMAVLEQIGYGLGSFFGNIVGGFLGGVSSGLPEIGANLSAFMVSMQPFFDVLSTINTESVTGVKALAETILILTAANILEGLTSWFTGGASLTEFGAELAAFGPLFKQYADSVNGIDGSAVEASANAAKALAAMATELPNSGGVAGWFAGENSLSAFADELVVFGPKLKQYADSVSGLDGGVVENSASAAQAMSELASGLPNSGGMVSWFTGDNSLSAFADELVAFGPKFKQYADSVSGVDGSVVTASASAAQALSELASGLPNSGGMVSWFTGDNDLASFGANLVSFGNALSQYSNAISGINTSKMSSVVTEMNRLVSLTHSVSGANVKGLSNFASSLGKIGSDGVNAFVNAFNGASGKVSTSASNMITSFINAINSKQGSIKASCTTLVSACVTAINSKYSSFYNAGKYLVQGFAAGITANTYLATARAKEMAAAADRAARAELGVKSPSRAFIAIGRFIGEGLAQGIRDNTWQAVQASEEMSARVKEAASKSFEDAEKLVENYKAFDELSLAEELEIWEAMIAKYGTGTEERLKAEKKAYAVYKELRSKDYQDSMDWIEREKYYKRLSLEEELAAYERVQARYQWGSDEWLKMEKEKYQVKNEIMNASYEHSMDWIEKEAMTLGEELAGWQRVMARFGPGGEMENAELYAKAEAKYFQTSYEHSEEWINKQESLYDKLAGWKRVQARFAPGGEMFNKELYQKATKEIESVQDEITKINEDYYNKRIEIQEDYLDQKKDLEEEEAERSKEIKEKLKEDIQAVNDAYDDAVDSRRQSLYDAYGLFDKVDPLKEVKGEDLFDSLRSQVSAFEDWQSDINSLAGKGINNKLLDELREMGPSSAAEVKALNTLSTHELNEYVALWQEKYNLANEQAIYELESMRQESNVKIKQLVFDSEKELQELNDVYDKKLDDLRTDTNKALNNLYDDWVDQLGILKQDTTSEFTDMVDNWTTVIGDKYKWQEIGANIVNGIIQGLRGKASDLNYTIDDIMHDFNTTAEKAEDINSPSKKFAQIGKYCILGLVEGIKNSSQLSYNTISEVGTKTLSKMTLVMDRLSDMSIDGVKYTPTIQPVLDLSQIQNGVQSINGMFNIDRTLSLGLSIGKVGGQQIDSIKCLENTTLSSNGKIVDAIGTLRGDIATLAEVMRNFKIYMDTGSLVGAISPEMDKSLGEIANLSKRGL